MSINSSVLGKSLDSAGRSFHKQLSAYTIIDLAILETISKTAKGIYGTLRSSKPSYDGAVTTYSGVELLSLGGLRGGFFAGGDGEDLYMVFGTASSMESTSSRLTDDDPNAAYSARSLKAIPLASALSWVSKAGFDRTGNFTLEFPDSSLSFGVDSSILYKHGDLLRFGKSSNGALFISILGGKQEMFVMPDGSKYSCLWGNGNYLQEIQIRRVTGEQIIRRWSTRAMSSSDREDITNVTDFLFEETLDTSGARTETYKNASGVTIAQEYIDTSGKRTLTSAGFEVAAGLGKIKLATSVFNYSSWLTSVINTLKTAAVDPSTHVVNAATITALTALQTQLSAGTE